MRYIIKLTYVIYYIFLKRISNLWQIKFYHLGEISMDEFKFIMWIIGDIVLAILFAKAASKKGRNPVGFFFLFLIVGPLISLIIFKCMKDKSISTPATNEEEEKTE